MSPIQQRKTLDKLFGTKKHPPQIAKRFIKRFSKIWSYVGWDDYIAFVFLLIGLLCFFDGLFVNFPRLSNFIMDIRSELIGMSLSVLIIANAVEVIGRREEKKRLILQMGSPNNIFAVEGLRQLAYHGWTRDGTLVGAKLPQADLHEADLTLANMANVNLNGAILNRAKLKETNLQNATLIGTSLIETDLSLADLTSAILRESNCSGALFCSARLVYTDLEQANLSNADLRFADLTWADLTDAKLTNAKYNEATKWPMNFNPKDAGLILDQNPVPGWRYVYKEKIPQKVKAEIYNNTSYRLVYGYATKQRISKKRIVIMVVAFLISTLIFIILGNIYIH